MIDITEKHKLFLIENESILRELTHRVQNSNADADDCRSALTEYWMQKNNVKEYKKTLNKLAEVCSHIEIQNKRLKIYLENIDKYLGSSS